ncbi:MAG TPA: M10 family metallopeptidase C-terminal domain-containing protein, partial [Tepidisphaeraceae bacterium]|nr:M10 family metallopeptidase C-terminal domain-containing protein [Tepidisphaeraceae bacterium]
MMNRDSRAYKLLVRAYQSVARKMRWLNVLAEHGVQPVARQVREEVDVARQVIAAVTGKLKPVEALERRVMLSITPVLSGTTVTFTGDSAADHLYLQADTNNVLQFSTDGTLYTSDLDPSTSGIQSLTVDPSAVINVGLGGGTNVLTLDSSLAKIVATSGASLVDTGAGTSDTLAITASAADSTNVWNLSGPGAGDLNQQITFTGMTSLAGGTNADDFSFDPTFTGTATESLDGGGGTNTLDYFAFNTGVTVNLTTGAATDTAGVSRIQKVVGGMGNDSLTGSGTATTLTGSHGSDSLVGGAGSTTFAFRTGWGSNNITAGLGSYSLDFSAVIADLTFNLGTGIVSDGTNQVTFSASKTQALTGGSGNNTFVFPDSGMVGAAGAGTIDGGTGGTNTLDYSAYASAIAVDLSAGTATGTGGISDIQNVIGGSGNDVLAGDTHDNVLTVGSGQVSLTGGGGNDTLKFTSDAIGTDSIAAGASGEIDTVDFSAFTTPININLTQTGAHKVGTNLSLNLATGNKVENVVGGSGNDTITGNSSDNVLNGGGGTNSIVGNGGHDSFPTSGTVTVSSSTPGTITAGGSTISYGTSPVTLSASQINVNGFSSGGQDVTFSADTIDVGGTINTVSSDGLHGGKITLTGKNITIEGTAKLLANGTNTPGAIDIEASDTALEFIPFANVHQSSTSIMVETGALIQGAAITIHSLSDHTHILSPDTTDGSIASSAVSVTDTALQGLMGLSNIIAGVAYSRSDSTVTIQSGTEIDGTDVSIHSAANANATTAPITVALGPAVAIARTYSTETISGKIVATGKLDINSSTNHVVNVVADTSGLKGFAGSISVGVVDSNATADVTSTADLTVGGDLTVEADTTNASRNMARAVAGADGSLAIAIAVEVENNTTNAFLDGQATVTGSVNVAAQHTWAYVPALKLFLLPTFVSGVSAQAGVGSDSTGDLLDDTKADAIAVIADPIKAYALKKFNELRGKKAETADDANTPLLPADIGAGVDVYVVTNNDTARIGDGVVSKAVKAHGTVTVQSAISDFPATSVSASASTDPNAPDNAAPNKFAGAVSVGVGVFTENANAYISHNATVDSEGTLSVTANSEQPYSWQLLGGINIVELLASSPTHTTDDGSTSVSNGDTVLVKGAHQGPGSQGDLYQYTGAPATIDLSTEDFTDTGRWMDMGNPIVNGARTFIAALSSLLTSNLSSLNLFTNWGDAEASGNTNVAVAGTFTVDQYNRTVNAIIQDGAQVNQDTNYQKGAQDVYVHADAETQAVNAMSNINLPGVQGNNKKFKIDLQKPGLGTGTENGKGAVGVSFGLYDLENQVTAKIEDNAHVHGDDLAVTAGNNNLLVDIGASGGKSNGVAFNGVVAVNIVNNTTIAQIARGAIVDIGSSAALGPDGSADPDANGASVYVAATDLVNAIEILGGVAVSDHVGIGATVGLNYVTRDTESIIGQKTDDNSVVTAGSLTSGGDIRSTAQNSGFDGAFTVSGSATKDPSPSPESGHSGLPKDDGSGSVDDPNKLPNNQNNYDKVIAQLKAKFGETSDATSTDSPGNATGKSGISISGAVSIDIVDDNARAYARNSGAIDATAGQVIFNASNTTSQGSLSGAVALALGGATNQQRQVGIAGSVGANFVSGTTDAFIDGATSVTATGLHITASQTGTIVAIVAGLAYASGRSGDAVAASVALTRTEDTTEAGLRNTSATI